MAENNERIGIKLNRLTVIAFMEFKNLLYGNPDIPVSESFLLEEGYKKIFSKINKINWMALNKANIPNVSSNNDASISQLHTTLSIDPEIFEGLKNLQREMAQAAQSRIFFSFVVKLVMFASILECQGLLDNYLL